MKDIFNKMFTSIPVLVLLCGVPFGIIMYLVNGATIGAAVGGVISGLFFGLIMAYYTRHKYETNLNLAKRVNVERSKKLDMYLKEGRIPNDVSEIERLKVYMTALEKRNSKVNAYYYPKKYSKFITYTFILAMFVSTILLLENYRWVAIIYPVVIGISLYGEYRERTLMKQIKNVRQKLPQVKS